MRIALCDDQKTDREQMLTYLRKELEQHRVVVDVMAFGSGEALLAQAEKTPFDACFLDIYMDGISGIQLAYRLAKLDAKVVIVFITSSPDHMAEGFEIGAVHYLVKPVTQGAVGKALGRILRLCDSPKPYITLPIGRVEKQVLLEKILYIESRERQCMIYTKDGTLQPYARLNALEAMLDSRFLRCHRSFLINMDHTQGVFPEGFLLHDGTVVPIKRDKRTEMKRRFEQYCFDKLRKEMG